MYDTHTPNLLPIRKLVATAVGAGVMALARSLGLDLGVDEVNEAAMVAVALLFGYLTPDPRVTD